MPSVSERQRKFFGAEYGRAKRGQRTKTGISKAKLRHFAGKVKSPSNPTLERFR